MATADKLEWPQGTPLFELAFRAISEGMNGVGVLASGDMEVTSTANANEISVSTGDLWVPGTTHTIGTAETHTLSDNTSGSDRWDTVVFDTGTGASAVKEGTAAAEPEPPDLASGEILLAYIYVPDGATDTPDSNIYNWRAFSTDAADVRLDDSAGDFQNSNVEDAFTEVIREAGDPLNGPLDLSSFSGGSVLDLGTNPGAFGAIVDLAVDSNSAGGTEHSFLFAVDGGTLLKVYAESDGSGGVQNLRVEFPQEIRVADDVTDDRGNTLYSYSSNEFTQARLGGPASSLTSYPLPIGDLNNPYGLDELTDMDADGSDLSDSQGPGTLYNASEGEFVRGVLDDARTYTVVTSSTHTTSGEEVILVDTAAIAGSSTITLASADVEGAREVAVTDLSGSASTYPITIETEGSETIDGASTKTVATDYAGATFTTQGTNWVVPSPPPLDPAKQVEGAESGAVATGEQGTLIFDHLGSGETLEIYKGIFTLDTGEPVPSSLDLVIATLDNSGNYTSQTTIFSGDGSTIWDGDPSNSIGDPLASFTASSATTVAVLADNQTASSQSIMAKITGERVP